MGTAPRQQIRLRAIQRGALAAGETLLPLAGAGSTCSVRLRCMPGASGVHLLLSAAAGSQVRAEVPATGGEEVAVQVELGQDGALRVWSPRREMFMLPLEELYDPAPLIQPAAQDASLDLVLVIDGTLGQISRQGPPPQGRPEMLLDRNPQWESHVEKLCDFVERIASGRRDCRAAVVAFADLASPDVTAKDLVPRYHLFPDEEERSLQPLEPSRLLDALLAIPASSGGDFVDALADAMDAGARLHWRPEARKVLVLSGDSPGHSLLYPLPRGADLIARARDVDTQALALHRLGVETVTIYHAPAVEATLDFRRQLLRSASDQYARLASLPEMAFRAATFEPAPAAAVVGRHDRPIGRGAAWGELVEVQGGAGKPGRAASARPPATANGHGTLGPDQEG